MKALDTNFIDLLEIDTFRVVKDKDFANTIDNSRNNFTEHWISHLCKAYLENPEYGEDSELEVTGAFDSDEIHEGRCYYCKLDIPEPIIALWSMLEWKDAADLLQPYKDEPITTYKVSDGTP